MRSFTPPGAKGRCARCLLLSDFCVCGAIGVGLPTTPAVVVVRHRWEAWKSTNTARLAHLALSNSRILDMSAEHPEPVREELARLPGAWLVYPGVASPQSPAEVPQTLVVLDGTWRQTRKMLRRLPELSSFPRLSLPDDAPDRRRLRQPPVAGARSTIEAIAEALGQLGQSEPRDRLLRLHDLFVAQTLRSRGQLKALPDLPTLR